MRLFRQEQRDLCDSEMLRHQVAMRPERRLHRHWIRVHLPLQEGLPRCRYRSTRLQTGNNIRSSHFNGPVFRSTGVACTRRAVSTRRASTNRAEASRAPARRATPATEPFATTSTNATARRTLAIVTRSASTPKGPTGAAVTKDSLVLACLDSARVRCFSSALA